jgi:hypothetical protein
MIIAYCYNFLNVLFARIWRIQHKYHARKIRQYVSRIDDGALNRHRAKSAYIVSKNGSYYDITNIYNNIIADGGRVLFSCVRHIFHNEFELKRAVAFLEPPWNNIRIEYDELGFKITEIEHV